MYLAGVCFMVGSVIQGLIVLNVKDYVWHSYHGTLLTIAVIAFSIVFNTSLATRLPLIEGIVLILHLVGFFAIIIPLWVLAPRAKPSAALLQFSNNGGWSSTGLSAMIGLTSPVSVMIGYDCSVHMCKAISTGIVASANPMFLDSRRGSGCFAHASESHNVVHGSELPSRLHHGGHPYLHPRRHRQHLGNSNIRAVHSGVLQRYS